jgi:hypothetical protein
MSSGGDGNDHGHSATMGEGVVAGDVHDAVAGGNTTTHRGSGASDEKPLIFEPR